MSSLSARSKRTLRIALNFYRPSKKAAGSASKAATRKAPAVLQKPDGKEGCLLLIRVFGNDLIIFLSRNDRPRGERSVRLGLRAARQPNRPAAGRRPLEQGDIPGQRGSVPEIK